MSRRFYNFQGSHHEIQAALHLRHLGPVLIDIPESKNDKIGLFLDAGFKSIPMYIESAISLPFCTRDLSRKHKKQIKDSIAAWHQKSLTVEVYDLESLGRSFLIKELYFQILLPEYYAKGISPYNSHNQESFEKLLTSENYFVIVYQKGHIAGGAILRPQVMDESMDIVKGSSLKGNGVEGLVYALKPEFHLCNRAFIFHMVKIFESLDMTFFSYGKDTPWIDDNYLKVIIEKMRWCDHVALAWGNGLRFFSPGPIKDDEYPGINIITKIEESSVLLRFGHSDTQVKNVLRYYLPTIEFYE